MSNALNILKAQQVRRALRRTFDDVDEIDINLRPEGELLVLTATYTGSEEYQVITGCPEYRVETAAKGVTPGALYAQLLHPLDHWVDVIVNADKLAQDGLL